MSARHTRSWTCWKTTQLREVRNHAASGLTMAEAGAMIGRTSSAIKNAAHRHGISFPRKSVRGV